MPSYSAYEAKQRFGDVLREARQGPVAIRRYRRPVAYVLSAKEYRRFAEWRDRERRREVSRLIDNIGAADEADVGTARRLITMLCEAERVRG